MLPRLVLPLLLCLATAAPVVAQRAPIVVYLVRHAERAEDGTDDPPISMAGEERARLLADMLRDAALTQIHTTDFLRTRATAAPISDQAGLEPTLYGVDDLGAFAALLRATPGRHLVVGHSNTIPVLVGALGGDPGGPIEQDEYDRLYMLTLTEAAVTTVLIRFGELYGN
jgi:broad specificity phosphatase PhoE